MGTCRKVCPLFCRLSSIFYRTPINYNIFLKTLLDLDNSIDFSLGEYAYSGDGDKLISEILGVYITCGDNKYSVFDLTDNTLLLEESIPQKDKLDIKDRIEIGLEVIHKVRELNK